MSIYKNSNTILSSLNLELKLAVRLRLSTINIHFAFFPLNVKN